MVIIIVFICQCQIILVKFILSCGHTYFLYDVVIKGFYRGYVVWVGQLVKCQVSDGRARDYLAVAFQYFVGLVRSHINSRS